MPLVSFSCLIALARSPSNMLNKGESVIKRIQNKQSIDAENTFDNIQHSFMIKKNTE
jgi:hypothetical protein